MKSHKEHLKDAVQIGQALADIQTIAAQVFNGNDLDLVLHSVQRLKSDIKSGYNNSLRESVGEGSAKLITGIF